MCLSVLAELPQAWSGTLIAELIGDISQPLIIPHILSCINFPSNSTYLNLSTPTLTFHIPKCFALVGFFCSFISFFLEFCFLFFRVFLTIFLTNFVIVMVRISTNNMYTVKFSSCLNILQKLVSRTFLRVSIIFYWSTKQQTSRASSSIEKAAQSDLKIPTFF